MNDAPDIVQIENEVSAKKGANKGKKRTVIILSIVAAVLLCFTVLMTVFKLPSGIQAHNTSVVTYEGPKTMKTSADADIKVNGNNLFVYDSVVNNTHTWVESGDPQLDSTPMTYFDFDGTVKIEVTMPKLKINTCKISPLSENIKPNISGNTVTFTVNKPGAYTLQFNDSPEKAVHIFANGIEKNAPKKGDKDVIYVEPGEWDIDNINVESGKTLYISGGAVVHGTITANMAKNVKICGRGIIDGSKYDGWKLQGSTSRIPLDFEHCDTVSVEGIILNNPNAWTLQAFDTANGTIDNVKIISARPNGDGITLQSCEKFKVSNSFVRTWDDSLVVKNYDTSSQDITFSNMQVWTDLAQSCEIGYETNKGKIVNSTISKINFENITVINNFHKPVISIHNSDDAYITNINYKNIVVENAQMGSGDAGDNNQLIDFGIMNSSWSTTLERGKIYKVSIDGLKVLSGKVCPSRIEGYDEKHTIENVSIKNLSILGKKITSLDDGKFDVNEYTKNINIE